MSDRKLLRYWMPTEFSNNEWTKVQHRISEVVRHWFGANPDEARKLVFGIDEGDDRKWYRLHVLKDSPFDAMDAPSGYQEIHLNSSGFGLRTEEAHTLKIRQQPDAEDEITTMDLASLNRPFGIFAFTILQMIEHFYPGSVRVSDNDLARVEVEASNSMLAEIFGCDPTLDPEKPLSNPKPTTVRDDDMPDFMDFSS